MDGASPYGTPHHSSLREHGRVDSSRLRSADQTAFELWKQVQVELHGCYSFERLFQLKAYTTSASLFRVSAVSLLTPVPTLLLITLMDCVSLARPEAGIGANYVFWVRNYLTIVLITLSALQQFRSCLPDLPLSNKAMWTMTLLATNGSVGLAFGLCFWIGFPLPFIMVIGTPVWAATLLSCTVYLWGRRVRENPKLVPQLVNFVTVFNCQISMTLIYPLFIFVFNSLSTQAQTGFVILLPIIKLIIKNILSHFLKDMDGMKPEMVIFNVEIFNALYVLCCIQNSPSIITIAVIMAFDSIQAILSIMDVNEVLNDLTKLASKMPGHYATAPFMDTAVEILRIDPFVRHHPSLKAKMGTTPSPDVVEGVVFSKKRIIPASLASIVPSTQLSVRSAQGKEPPRKQTWSSPNEIPADTNAASRLSFMRGNPGHILMTTLSATDCLEFVQTTLKVLFLSEFIVLVEYTEVIMPVVYCLYMSVVFHLPNREFYSQISQLSSDQLQTTVLNVLAYTSLEFVTFVVVSTILRRKLQLFSMHQLAFVLDKQRVKVQAKIMLWTFYGVQSSLFHFGFDFSFKFAWLRELTELHLSFDRVYTSDRFHSKFVVSFFRAEVFGSNVLRSGSYEHGWWVFAGRTLCCRRS